MKNTITVSGVRLVRSNYLGDPAWATERDGRIVFYKDDLIPVPAPRGSRIRSGADYAPKWKCLVDGKSYPYIGAWYNTMTEIIERLTSDGYF